MTLNSAISRIRTIVQAHKQVRTFEVGNVGDFLADKKTKYAAVFLQYAAGAISISRKVTELNYKLFVMDLVHVSQDAKDNEQDVLSDMLSVGIDLIAQINAPQYNDWKISTDNNIQFVTEGDGDMYAGIVIDISISFMFVQNRCQIPSTLIDYTSNPDDMKLVFDTTYVATGDEGLILTTAGIIPNLPELNGKKILFVTREFGQLYKVSNSPNSSEFTWNNTEIGLGAITGPGERFLILYRNY